MTDENHDNEDHHHQHIALLFTLQQAISGLGLIGARKLHWKIWMMVLVQAREIDQSLAGEIEKLSGLVSRNSTDALVLGLERYLLRGEREESDGEMIEEEEEELREMLRMFCEG
ncbi:hypothetical protein Slin14017_G053510 [Septoria linicola]|nr:hypothetical protein Slin14017_G053510 [Septoria linicola]